MIISVQLRFVLAFVSGLFDHEQAMLVGHDMFLSETLPDLCPYSDSCTRPSKLDFKHSRKRFMPCCLPCSCEEDCTIRGTCCHDAIKTNFTEMSPKRASTQCISSTYRPGATEDDGLHYYAVTACPVNYPHKTTTRLCQTDNPKRLDQLLIVSDDEGIFYKNLYCARCNGVLKFTPWILNAVCNGCNTSRYGVFEPTLKFVMQNDFSLRSRVPSNIPFPVKQMCFKSVVNTCNITGMQTTYDPNIYRACREGPNMTYISLFPKLRIYKNVFCFLCNVNSRDWLKNVCPLQDEDDMVKGIFPPFTAVLYLDSLQDITGSSESKCEGSEVYDWKFDVCRKLICPANTFANLGKCTKSYDVSIGLSVRFNIVLRIPYPLTINQSESQSIIKTIAQEIYYFTGFEESHCSLCQTVCWQESTMNATFIANVNLMTTSKCSVSDILKIISDMKNATFQVSFNERIFNFTLHFETENIELSELELFSKLEHLGLEFSQYSVQNCGEAISLAEFKCPRVLISGLNFMKAIGRKHAEETDYFKTYNLGVYGDNELAKTYFEICLDDYFGKLNSHATRSVYVSVHILVYTLSVYQFSLHSIIQY